MAKECRGRQLLLQALPPEILEEIFELLSFRERIRLERVCRTWRSLSQTCGWNRLRFLEFSREMLQIREPWKDSDGIDRKISELNDKQTEVTNQVIRDFVTIHGDCDGHNFCPGCPKATAAGRSEAKYGRKMREAQQNAMREYKKVLSDPKLYRQQRPSRQLVPLKEVLRRCGPRLGGLRLAQNIGVDTRFGRFFSQLPALQHLRLDCPLDRWHLTQIQEHFADRLLSLSITTETRKDHVWRSTAIASLLANCQRLECLGIDRLECLFTKVLPPAVADAAADSASTYTFMPIAPPTLKSLQVFKKHYYYTEQDIVTIGMPLLLEKCPNLRFLLSSFSEEYSPSEEVAQKLFSLQWPFFYSYSNNYTHQMLTSQHSRLQTLRAVKLDSDQGILGDDLSLLAECCPQLEHLDFRREYWANWSEQVPLLEDFEPLYLFKRLSSLGLTIEVYRRGDPNCSVDFRDLFCTNGQSISDALLSILAQMNGKHPLRSLQIHYSYHYNCMKLTSDFCCRLLQTLTHLETLSCPLIDITQNDVAVAELCQVISALLIGMASNHELKSPMASRFFRFLLTQYFYHSKHQSLIIWHPGAEKAEVRSTNIESERYWLGEKFTPDWSVVFHEIADHFLDRNTKQILFGQLISEESRKFNGDDRKM